MRTSTFLTAAAAVAATAVFASPIALDASLARRGDTSQSLAHEVSDSAAYTLYGRRDTM